MFNNKELDGIWNAPPEKRYRNFLNTVTDLEEIWFSATEEGCTTFDMDGFVHVLVWPKKVFCDFMATKMSEKEKSFSLDIHDFLRECEDLDDSYRFMVFPTDKDSYVVTKNKLYEDIAAYLQRLE